MLVVAFAACSMAAASGCSSNKGSEGEIMLFPSMPMPMAGSMSAGGGGSASSAGAGGASAPGAGAPSAAGTHGDETSMPSQSGNKPDHVIVDGSVPASPTADASSPNSLIGWYAVKFTHRDTITVGLAGTASMVTTVLARAEIQEGSQSGELQLSLSLCDYEIGMNGEKHLTDLTLSIPSAVLASTELDPATITVTDGSGADATWVTSEVRGAAGWNWSTPSDVLPTDAADARVIDQDNDGQPGISVPFTGHEMGTLYLAMAFRWTFSGTLAAGGELLGSTQSSCEETLLGSDQDPLIVSSFVRVPDPDMTDDTVQFVPRASEPSCGDVVGSPEAIFQ